MPVVLIRHAQGHWNREHRFTGWADPSLTIAGIREAVQAARCLHHHGFRFDAAWSSRLQRATATRDLILARTGERDVQRFDDWRLNERHYGALQGLDKLNAIETAGTDQVWRWRRGYLDRAEPLSLGHPMHPANDERYADVDYRVLPAAENLAETRSRVAQFWREKIQPQIRRGKRILISAHGNTLRALIMELSDMDAAQVEGFEVPTATPILYNFTAHGKPLHWHYLSVPCGLAMPA